MTTKEVSLSVFYNVEDAILWIESQVWDLIDRDYEDIKAELSLIDGAWRAGVIADSRQGELFDN